MTIYNGWTPPVRPASLRDRAINRLILVADRMTDQEYQIWFDDAIRAGMQLEQIIAVAEAKANSLDECSCNGSEFDPPCCPNCRPKLDADLIPF